MHNLNVTRRDVTFSELRIRPTLTTFSQPNGGSFPPQETFCMFAHCVAQGVAHVALTREGAIVEARVGWSQAAAHT